MYEINTERLSLRQFNYDDVENVYRLNTIPEIIRYVGNTPFESMEQAREYLIKHPINDYEKYGYGRLACVLKETNKVIGFCGLKYLPEIDETELGYRFLPEYWGAGLATEAAKAVLSYAKSELGLSRIVGCVHPENSASKNVLKKLGFNVEKKVNLEFMGEIDVDLFVKNI